MVIKMIIDKLIEMGIEEKELQNIYNFIDENNQEDFLKIVCLLEEICDNQEIENIIIGNPLLFSKSYNNILELVTYMHELGFNNLNLLFDSYPAFLNKEKWEIENYIKKRLENRELTDIIDELESNPLLIEME